MSTAMARGGTSDRIARRRQGERIVPDGARNGEVYEMHKSTELAACSIMGLAARLGAAAAAAQFTPFGPDPRWQREVDR